MDKKLKIKALTYYKRSLEKEIRIIEDCGFNLNNELDVKTSKDLEKLKDQIAQIERELINLQINNY